jgi:hypothetical protein
VFAHRFPGQTDLVGAVHEAVEDGGGRGAVVIEDLRPLLEGAMGGNDGGAVLVALTDDLEQGIGAQLGYLPMNRQGTYNLFQLMNGLYEFRSVILTTN